MTRLYDSPFQPVNSTAPSFNSTLGSSQSYALESTARFWQLPTGRAVRVAGKAATPYSIQFGSSLVSPSTQTSLLVPNGGEHVFRVDPSQTYIGIASSTDVTVNVTLGTGR